MTPSKRPAPRSRPNRRLSAFSAMSLAGVVVLAGACGEGPRPFTPTPVVVAPPARAPVTHTLSGVVFEETGAGRRPIEGASVYCDSCGDPLGHTFAYTNTEGVYSLEWAANGETPLLVEKDGYQQTGVVAHVQGDTRFDIQLERR